MFPDVTADPEIVVREVEHVWRQHGTMNVTGLVNPLQ
jgi:hypothetical protein